MKTILNTLAVLICGITLAVVGYVLITVPPLGLIFASAAAIVWAFVRIIEVIGEYSGR